MISKNSRLGHLAWFPFLVLACVSPTSKSSNEIAGPAPGLGRVVANLTIDSSRGVLPNELSRDLANTYEILLTDGNSLKTAALKLGSSTSVDVVPGSYRLLALAGYRRSDTSTVAELVGTAYGADSIAVIEGQTTVVELSMKAIDFSWSAPASLAQGEAGKIIAHGATGNPYVGMSLVGSSTTERPRLKSLALWNGYKDFPAPTGSSDNWDCAFDFTCPTSSGTADLQFQGAVVVLQNVDAASGSLAGRAKYSWKWLNRYDMADDGPLVPLVEKTINMTPPSTGLAVGITWG